MESEGLASAAPDVGTAQQQLDFELAVLGKLPGASSVTDFPKGGVAVVKPNDLQANGVRFKLDGRLIKQTFNGDISDKVKAARVLKDRMKSDAFVGEAAVLAAEEQVRRMFSAHCAPEAMPPAELTEADLLWLSDWYDEQAEPDQVTLDQANAALASHRGTSATQILFEAQVTAAIEFKAGVTRVRTVLWLALMDLRRVFSCPSSRASPACKD